MPRAVHSFISRILVLVLVSISFIPMGVSAVTTQEVIEEGDDWNEIIRIGGGNLWYRVEVIGEGMVDVYMSLFLYLGIPDTGIDTISGHRHEGVTVVEDTIEKNYPSINLIVDNSNKTGFPSTGDVTVKIQWEEKMDSMLFIPGLIVIIGIGVGLAVLWAKKRSDARGPKIHDRETAMELQRVLAQDEAVGAAGEDPGTGAYCAGCGSEKKKSLRTGRIYCPNCDGQ
jgi:hypothetical protein